MKVIIDCNSFYASCEQVFRPEIAGHPIVVLSNNDGCLIARNDKAKQLGISMGQPYFMVRELCTRHRVHIFSSNYALYGDMSRRVMDTIASIYPSIEVYSIDEAFLDIQPKDIPIINTIASTIRDRVLQWTGIPVSIGVGSTKVLSKVANRLAKRDKLNGRGIYIIQTEADRLLALQQTAVADVWGIGYRHQAKLQYQHIDTAYSLSLQSEAWASRHLGGVEGVRLIRELNGIPCYDTRPGLTVKKQIASTRSFGDPVTTLSSLQEAVATYTARAAEKLRQQHSAAGAIYVFALSNRHDPHSDYHRRGIYYTLPVASSATAILIQAAVDAVAQIYQDGVRYKKAGVILSAIVSAQSIQQHLFEPTDTFNRNQKVSEMLDRINRKMGIDTLAYAATGVQRNWKMRAESRSPCYTTRWADLPVVR